MVVGIFGESCTGKSTLAQLLKNRLNAEVYTGKDYLRFSKNENMAKKLFRKELEKAVSEQLQNLEAQLAQQGLNMEMYCAFMNTTVEDLRKDAYPAAEAAMRNLAAVDKIVALEKLTASEEEVKEAIALVCQQNNMTEEELQPYLNEEFEQALHRSIMTTKVMKLIRDAAIITEG